MASPKCPPKQKTPHDVTRVALKLFDPKSLPGHRTMTSNVYALPRRFKTLAASSPFDQLTDQLVMEQAKAGTLNPAIVEALLAAVRQPARECGR